MLCSFGISTEASAPAVLSLTKSITSRCACFNLVALIITVSIYMYCYNNPIELSICITYSRSKLGVFTATVPLSEGRHDYNFLVDGEWMLDVNQVSYSIAVWPHLLIVIMWFTTGAID